MDAGKGQRLRSRRGSNDLLFLIAPGAPTTQLKLLVEEQVAARFPLLHRQCRERLMLLVRLHHAI